MVGHLAIKMLSYVEMLEAEIKHSLAESYKKKNIQSPDRQEDSKEDDLA